MVAILLACLWAGWVILNVVLLLVGPNLVKGASGPYTNGLRVVIPEGLAQKVTVLELHALLQHEQGHIAHRHNLKNLVRACCFVPRSAALLRRQEIEADDYSANHSDPAALASALRKLSFNDFDWQRAARLSRIAASRQT